MRKELALFLEWIRENDGVRLYRDSADSSKPERLDEDAATDLIEQYYDLEDGTDESHPHVEFQIIDIEVNEHKTFKRFSEASEFAINQAIATEESQRIEVIVYTKEGAIWWMGEDAGNDHEIDDIGDFVADIVEITAEIKTPIANETKVGHSA